MANVTVIPAKPKQELNRGQVAAKLRVCAYARVSSDDEEQLTSYEAQLSHYTDHIKNNPAWEFVKVYADEAITGTNTKKREDFKRMLEDCLAGKIDRIITKSVSRFARNTLDTLQYVRQLKEKNIAIFFEKENINTLHSKGELLISILASLAQEESNTISQNTKLGIAFRFQEGKVLVDHKKFLGYTKDENGELVIVAEEAEIVRRIYKEFLEGKNPFKIAAGLERDGKRTGSHGSRWYDSTVKKILKNEKYMGDALLQKTYTVDFLTKKRVTNSGQAAQYYVEDSHPAIICKEEFAAVQMEMERRANLRGYSKTGKSKFTSDYAFSGKLFCGNCGSKFRRTKWGKGKNEQIVWICINHQMGGNEACDIKAVKEKALEQAFIRVMNRLIAEKGGILEQSNFGVEEYRVEELQARIEESQTKMVELTKTGFDEKEYTALAGEIDWLREQIRGVKGKETKRGVQAKYEQELQVYIMEQENEISKFHEGLFCRFIEKVRVRSMVEVEFVFKTGVEVKEVL